MVAFQQVICLGLRDVMMTLVQCLLCVYVCHNYWKQGQFQRSSKEKVLLEVILLLILCVPDATIPHICHRHHRRCLCKKELPGVNFYRFNAKNWQFTV